MHKKEASYKIRIFIGTHNSSNALSYESKRKKLNFKGRDGKIPVEQSFVFLKKNSFLGQYMLLTVT